MQKLQTVNADTGGRCALPLFGGHVLLYPRQAVPFDGRSERAASLCGGKRQAVRRSYRAVGGLSKRISRQQAHCH